MVTMAAGTMTEVGILVLAIVTMGFNVWIRIPTLRCAQDRISHRDDNERRKKQRRDRQPLSERETQHLSRIPRKSLVLQFLSEAPEHHLI